MLSVCAVAALAAAMLLATAGVASADYHGSAVYQIELVAGDNGTSWAPVGQRGSASSGGGIWLWFALYPDGTADYSGSDCLEQGGRFGIHGAYPDRGDVTWTYSDDGNSVVISGVYLVGISIGLGTDVYVTITVPRLYGHYTGTIGTFLTFPDDLGPDPNEGTSVVEVAP